MLQVGLRDHRRGRVWDEAVVQLSGGSTIPWGLPKKTKNATKHWWIGTYCIYACQAAALTDIVALALYTLH